MLQQHRALSSSIMSIKSNSLLLLSICISYSKYYLIDIEDGAKANRVKDYEDKEESKTSSLKVFVLNTWGMPKRIFGGLDKELRMAAIGEHIAKSDYDVVLLQEVWMNTDHKIIKEKLGDGWHMTGFQELSGSYCYPIKIIPQVTPLQCSGLVIISKHPLVQKSFTKFNEQGGLSQGNTFAGKGIAWARIDLDGSLVDLYNIHTISETSNKETRQAQIKQFLQLMEETKDGDFIIVGGDFNYDPKDNDEDETTFKDLEAAGLINAATAFTKDKGGLTDEMATWGNPENTYTGTNEFGHNENNQRLHLDWIFYKGSGQNTIKTESYQVPNLKTPKDDEKVSFADHDALLANLQLTKA